MRLRTVLLRITVLVALVGFSVGILAGGVAAETVTPDLDAAITSADPAKPSLRLKNISDAPCQVATTAQGTVAITEVRQDGKTVQPTALDIANDEDIGYLLRSKLKTLKPGESIDVPLLAYKLQSGLVLRATTWSADAGVYSTQYALKADKPLKLAVGYSLPIAPKDGAPACGAVFATTIEGGTSGWLKIAAWVAAILLLTLLVLAGWLLRVRRGNNKDKKAAKVVAGVLVVLGLGMMFVQSPRVFADIVVPPDMQADYDSCMATLNSHPDITGPVLDAMNNPANHIEIVYTSGGSETTGYRNDRGGGNFTIYWNPDDTHRYAGSGGNADPCTSLYHEMYHVLDMQRGTFSRADCAGSGIETKEVMATRAQNVLRARLGMPERSHYGDRALPSGDCTAPSDPARCTGDRCGDTNGDPHLRTFDGLRYDFQAAGEFIAARNDSGSYELQVRQEPWANSRLVTINTVVAMKIDGDRVEIRAGADMTLLVNGKKQALGPKTLPGGGTLGLESGVVTITWKDGSLAYIRPVGSFGLALSVQPGEGLHGKLHGLLGDANGTSANDLRARGSDKTIKPEHDQLYPTFADSWRISGDSSLFSYEKGTDTDTYTDRSMPDKPADPKTLPGYAAAERFCKSIGLTDKIVLANCALDMAITGRPEFAKAALHSQSFSAVSGAEGTTWEATTAGEVINLTFDAQAGEKVFIAIPKTTLESQCGTLRLLAPGGGEVASGCIINGNGQIDGTVLPDTGTYTITLKPHGPPGSVSVRLLRITDKQGTITPDGPAITATIDQPGVVGRYTFDGQAGQRVYLDVPSSTLGSQCGILRLVAPAGNELAGGCIINGKGEIDTTVLPATGRYTIVVDTYDTMTGQASMRLILATAETREITMNGPAVTINLKKPGSIGQLTFDGEAGQRIFVDLPSSSLPSQCGVVRLRAPDNSIVSSGCIINGKGNLSSAGVILPATGRYTIVLNPTDDVTGTTTTRLRNR